MIGPYPSEPESDPRLVLLALGLPRLADDDEDPDPQETK